MVAKPSLGTIHQWKKSPTPGYGIGFLIRGVIERPIELFQNSFGQHDSSLARSSRYRSATGYVTAFDEKTKTITTSSVTYKLGAPFEKPTPFNPNDFDDEKGSTQMGLNGSCTRLSDEFSENDESLEDVVTLQELGFEVFDA